MSKHRFLLTVGTKLPIAMVGRGTTHAVDDAITAVIGDQTFTKDEARRIAANIAKLPELLQQGARS